MNTEYIGKMNLYLEALDREVKRKLKFKCGLILCASKDDEIVSDDKRKIIIKYRVKINKKDMIFYRLYAIYRGDY